MESASVTFTSEKPINNIGKKFFLKCDFAAGSLVNDEDTQSFIALDWIDF